jgi:hypothetical protein
MMTKTATPKAATPAKKPLFGLSGSQLKLVVGGSGVVPNTP